MLLPGAIGRYLPRLLSLLCVCRRFFLCLFRFFRAQVRPPSGSGLPSRWLRSAPVAWEVCPFPVPGPAVPVRLSRGPPARVLFPLYYIIRCLPFPSLVPSAVLAASSIRCIAAVYVMRPEIFSKKVPHLFCPFPASVYFCTRFRERRRRCLSGFPLFPGSALKKLPWKFGSVAVNFLSLQPVFPVPGSALKKRSLIGLHITIQVVQERVPLHGASG